MKVSGAESFPDLVLFQNPDKIYFVKFFWLFFFCYFLIFKKWVQV